MRILFLMLLLSVGVAMAMDEDEYGRSSSGDESDRFSDESSEIASVLSKDDLGRATYNLRPFHSACQEDVAIKLCEHLATYDRLYSGDGLSYEPTLGHTLAFRILSAYYADVRFERYPFLQIALSDICGRRPVIHELIRWTPQACVEAVLDLTKNNACNVGSVCDKQSQFPIHVAATFGYARIVAKLLLPEYGMEVDVRDPYKKTPLICAGYNFPRVPATGPGEANSKHLETVRLLLDYGAEVNAVDEHGQTALHKVVLANEDEYCPDCKAIISELGARGADQSIKDVNGKRAHDIARRKKHFGPIIPLFITEDGAGAS